MTVSILKTISTRNSYPWISILTKCLKCLFRQKQQCYNRARLSHHPEDWQLYYQPKKGCQQECREAYNNYINSFLDSRNGQITKRLNAFNDYFTSIFTQEDLSSLPKMNDSPFPDIPNISVSVEGVQCQPFTQSKTPQSHWTRWYFPHIFLRNCHMRLLMKNFQSSSHQGVLPAEWKSANVIPIFKKDDRSKTYNY